VCLKKQKKKKKERERGMNISTSQCNVESKKQAYVTTDKIMPQDGK